MTTQSDRRIRIWIGEPRVSAENNISSSILGWYELTNPIGEWRVLQDSFTIQSTRGSTINSLSITIEDRDNLATYTTGMDMVVEIRSGNPLAWKRVFGGVINRMRYSPIGIGRRIHIEALDYTYLLDKSTIRKFYDSIGQTDVSIIQDMFLTAGLDEINTALRVDGNRQMDTIDFQGQTLRSAMDVISSITGAVWYVDAYKRLVYKSPVLLDSGMVFGFDNGEHPYYNAEFVTTLGTFNQLEVQGGFSRSDNTTQTYTGDGVSRIYVMGSQANTTPMDLPQEGERILKVERYNGTQWQNLAVGIHDSVTARELEMNAGDYEVLWLPAKYLLTFRSDRVPLNQAGAFRVSGTYLIPALDNVPNFESIAKNGRTFQGSLIIPDIDDAGHLHDLAQAYIEDVGDKEIINFSTNEDGLEVGHLFHLNSEYFQQGVYGIHPNTGAKFIADTISVKVIGGTLQEYRVKGLRHNA